MKIYKVVMCEGTKTVSTFLGPAETRKVAAVSCLVRAKKAGKLTSYEFEVLKSVVNGRKINPLNIRCGFYWGKGVNLDRWRFGVFGAKALRPEEV